MKLQSTTAYSTFYLLIVAQAIVIAISKVKASINKELVTSFALGKKCTYFQGVFSSLPGNLVREVGNFILPPIFGREKRGLLKLNTITLVLPLQSKYSCQLIELFEHQKNLGQPQK